MSSRSPDYRILAKAIVQAALIAATVACAIASLDKIAVLFGAIFFLSLCAKETENDQQ